MDKEHILGILRAHDPELKAAGLAHVLVFGSRARGDDTHLSDVDLLAEFDPTKPVTLQGLARIEYQLYDLLGVEVDLSSVDTIYPRINARALAEAIVAF